MKDSKPISGVGSGLDFYHFPNTDSVIQNTATDSRQEGWSEGACSPRGNKDREGRLCVLDIFNVQGRELHMWRLQRVDARLLECGEPGWRSKTGASPKKRTNKSLRKTKKTKKQPILKHPSTDKWVKKMRYTRNSISTYKYYSALKVREILSFVTI